MKCKSLFLLLLISISIVSCAPEQSIKHPEFIPTDDINHSIQIIAPEPWNTFKPNKAVSLLVSNSSNRTITFNQDFDKKIFVIEKDQLTGIEDKMILINGHAVTLAPNDTAELVLRVDGKSEKTVIRVYVIGKFDDTHEPVSAYIDITLKP